jgi:hypothetical protein
MQQIHEELTVGWKSGNGVLKNHPILHQLSNHHLLKMDTFSPSLCLRQLLVKSILCFLFSNLLL